MTSRGLGSPPCKINSKACLCLNHPKFYSAIYELFSITVCLRRTNGTSVLRFFSTVCSVSVSLRPSSIVALYRQSYPAAGTRRPTQGRSRATCSPFSLPFDEVEYFYIYQLALVGYESLVVPSSMLLQFLKIHLRRIN